MCFQGKRVRRSDVDDRDLINKLPDEILIRILSLSAGVKEAASTDVLSRRWRHLWKSTSRLDFHYIPTDPKPFLYQRLAEFVQAVNQTINLHTSSTLKEFRVRYGLYDMDAPISEQFRNSNKIQPEIRKLSTSIPRWLEFALAKRVEILDLDLAQNNSSFVPPPALPPYLQIMSCPRQFPGFSSLRDLSFKGISVSGQVVEFFLQYCPFLERLSVHRSKDLKVLKVVGPSLVLKSLEICDCSNESRIEIVNATNLTRLMYTGSQKFEWSVKNVPLLVEVSLSGSIFRSTFKDWYEPISVSDCFSQLQSLTIGIHDGDRFAHFNSNELLFPRLQKLVLKYRVSDDRCILHYTRLIEASPLLKKFALHMSWVMPPDIDTQRKQEKKVGVEFHHKHLEEVELAGYYGLKSDLELAHYFIHNALSLKKVIIDPRNQWPLSTFRERCRAFESQTAA